MDISIRLVIFYLQDRQSKELISILLTENTLAITTMMSKANIEKSGQPKTDMFAFAPMIND